MYQRFKIKSDIRKFLFMLFSDHVCNASGKLLRSSMTTSKSLFLNKPRERHAQNFLLKSVLTQLSSSFMRHRFFRASCD